MRSRSINCVTSRAYHNAKNAALRAGESVEKAKESGRAAAADARAQAGYSKKTLQKESS